MPNGLAGIGITAVSRIQRLTRAEVFGGNLLGGTIPQSVSSAKDGARKRVE
jgi:hypothetical protein